MNLKSYILQDLFICSNDEKIVCFCFLLFILLYFIFPLYDGVYDLLIIKKEMSIYVLEKNILIKGGSHTFV